MATYTHTRRGILGAIAIAPVVIAAPAVAATSPIEAAWQEWRQASTQHEECETLSQAQEDALWERIESACDRIYNSTETGARAAEVRLWMAMSRAAIFKPEHAAVRREDLAHLVANHGKMEEGADQVIFAIRALRG